MSEIVRVADFEQFAHGPRGEFGIATELRGDGNGSRLPIKFNAPAWASESNSSLRIAGHAAHQIADAGERLRASSLLDDAARRFRGAGL